MARPVTRNTPVYWNGKKIGLAQKGEYSQNGAVGQEDTDDGTILTFGRIKTTCRVDILSPPGGPGIVVAVQEQGKLSLTVEGKLHTIEATCTEKSASWEAANGKTMSTWSFVGGAPEIT